jgi:dCMP deaminase
VIEGVKGYIIGAGWNDVGAGQIGCGYRHYEDIKNLEEKYLVTSPSGEREFRDRLIRGCKGKERESFCYKDEYSDYEIRKKLLRKIMKERREELKKLTSEQKDRLAQDILKGLNVKMMQFCRALHAEENAILQTSIIGGMGVSEGKIYTTTFPCELCAKKIYQANIRKVIYTEPYPRSISKDVFSKDGTRKIEFEQFEGIKSQSYFRLYKSSIDKKEFQMLQTLGT